MINNNSIPSSAAERARGRPCAGREVAGGEGERRRPVPDRSPRGRPPVWLCAPPREKIRGNHLSNTTCLTQVFFKSGEYFSTLW